MARIALVDTPIPEDSGISFNEQSGTPRENLAPVQPESSAEILPFAESQLNPSALEKEACEESSSMEETGLDSDSESVSESSSDSDA